MDVPDESEADLIGGFCQDQLGRNLPKDPF